MFEGRFTERHMPSLLDFLKKFVYAFEGDFRKVDLFEQLIVKTIETAAERQNHKVIKPLIKLLNELEIYN